MHIRTEAKRDVSSTHYNGKTYSMRFTCHVCGKHQRQALNWLGTKVLVCDGEKFHKVERTLWRNDQLPNPVEVLDVQ